MAKNFDREAQKHAGQTVCRNGFFLNRLESLQCSVTSTYARKTK